MEYEAVRDNASRLERLHDKIANIRVLDPACGCGNFLVIAYRELRRLELAILTRVADLRKDRQLRTDVADLVRVRLSNFYGIEIEEWPARIAETAMFLVDQQANHELARTFGEAPDRLPIMNAVNITVGNALRVDWESVLPSSECSYIVGNPPFIGMSMMSKEQQEDNRVVFSSHGGSRTGRLDYVACWYAKAVDYIGNKTGRVALVSSNSITQGEQARELGPLLAGRGFEIDFAHRTFAWTSEAPGAANVHVVIVGFSYKGQAQVKRIFEYLDIKSEPLELKAKNINIYLANSDLFTIGKHASPLVPNPKMTEGNKPQDGGGLIVEPEDLIEVRADPIASKYLRTLVGGRGMLHNENRHCLWLADASPSEIRSSTLLLARLKLVADTRLASPTAAAREKAKTPALFLAIRQPKSRWLAVPCTSSAGRRIVPMAFYSADDIPNNSVMSIDGADEYLFGVLQSAMFTTWVQTVSGRLKSDIRISADIAYNAFPFPFTPNAAARSKVEEAIADVLAARATHSSTTLAELYDPLVTPPDLVKAHDKLDAAVDALYTSGKVAGEGDRLKLLFARYAELTADLLTELPAKKTRKKKTD